MVLSSIRLSIIRKIEEYCADFEVSTDAFGRLAVLDSSFFARLQSGRNVTLYRIELALGFVDGERFADAIARQITGRAA
ncbi:MAG: hypothetical protein ABSC06_19645 [Rhodopila sp.]|jgi:hypothetical protein